MMRRILITGADSYLGTSLETYLKQWPEAYTVDTVDMIGDSWRDKDFSGYQTVFHVAGIAHSDFGKIAVDREALYRRVNTDLAIETAAKAKAEGVKQFIFMSTIVVYGQSAAIGKQKIITRETVPQPDNIYGATKLKAEEGLKTLEDKDFKLCILRPPMIYGKGCKGNYQRLARLARKTPVFPDIGNERSMLYTENLCAFIKWAIDAQGLGLFFPQNGAYAKTSELVGMIANTHAHRIWITKGFNPLLYLFRNAGIFRKVFGSIVYEHAMSRYPGCEYQGVSLEQSIRTIEAGEG